MQPNVRAAMSPRSSLRIAQRVGNSTNYYKAKRDCSAGACKRCTGHGYYYSGERSMSYVEMLAS
jgi:hypothetical protein